MPFEDIQTNVGLLSETETSKMILEHIKRCEVSAEVDASEMKLKNVTSNLHISNHHL